VRGDIEERVAALADLLKNRRVVALTGAGISTESGIPDYRGPESMKRNRKPITYREFVTDPRARKRYWARSAAGWPRMREALPNRGHESLARLETLGVVSHTITQNVDRLHQAAGSRRVLELHGALEEVRCLACGAVETRDGLQERLLALNPGFDGGNAVTAPDGDAVLSDVDGFTVPACAKCGGILKPGVVFFGESVPLARVDTARRLVDASEGLLVLGSSLAVFSGFRFVKQAAGGGKPVCMINRGATRGDGHARIKIDGPLGVILPRLVELVAGS
jgi:NAD-dependent SIR2 family protein deacetylase